MAMGWRAGGLAGDAGNAVRDERPCRDGGERRERVLAGASMPVRIGGVLAEARARASVSRGRDARDSPGVRCAIAESRLCVAASVPPCARRNPPRLPGWKEPNPRTRSRPRRHPAAPGSAHQLQFPSPG